MPRRRDVIVDATRAGSSIVKEPRALFTRSKVADATDRASLLERVGRWRRLNNAPLSGHERGLDVELTGFEPVTSALQGRRSPS